LTVTHQCVVEEALIASSDILTPQPIVGADVYYLRNIFHNWSDQYCIKILRNLIPALQPGASIVINDVVIPKPGTLSPTRERDIRSAKEPFTCNTSKLIPVSGPRTY